MIKTVSLGLIELTDGKESNSHNENSKSSIELLYWLMTNPLFNLMHPLLHVLHYLQNTSSQREYNELNRSERVNHRKLIDVADPSFSGLFPLNLRALWFLPIGDAITEDAYKWNYND